jgi:polyketide synthase PksN
LDKIANKKNLPPPPVLKFEEKDKEQTHILEEKKRCSRQPTIPYELLESELIKSFASVLCVKENEVDVHKTFTDHGLDSILGVEWMRLINKRFGTSLSATRVYDYPSISSLADYLCLKLSDDNSEESKNGVTPNEDMNSLKSKGSSIPSTEKLEDESAVFTSSAIEDELIKSFASVLCVKEDEVDVNKTFTDHGLDSILGVEWIRLINKRFGTSLSATRVYDYPSISSLAGYLEQELLETNNIQVSTKDRIEIQDTNNFEDILKQVQNNKIDIEKAESLLMTLNK